MKIKKALVLVKHSSYENYFKRPDSSTTLKQSLTASEIKRYKKTHDIHYKSLDLIQSTLKKLRIDFQMYFRASKIDYNRFDFIITVGGDGTFLEASHQVTTQAILGINSDPSWSVGRFCAANAQNFERYVQDYLKGDAHIQLLQRFSLKLASDKRKFLVLNDILICHKNPAAMSRYVLKVKDKHEEQRSSGIWVSTAAGSTGAIQSAGGMVLPPQSRLIQYKPRELYQGFGVSYMLKGGLLDSGDTLSVASLIREGVVFIDGSHLCVPFGLGDTLSIAHSNNHLRRIDK